MCFQFGGAYDAQENPYHIVVAGQIRPGKDPALPLLGIYKLRVVCSLACPAAANNVANALH